MLLMKRCVAAASLRRGRGQEVFVANPWTFASSHKKEAAPGLPGSGFLL